MNLASLPIPANYEEERGVLGAAFHDAGAAILVADCAAEWFLVERHRDVLRAIQNVVVNSDPVTSLTVQAAMERMRTWSDEATPSLLAALYDEATVAGWVPLHIDRVRDLARRRDLMRLGHQLTSEAADLSVDVDGLHDAHVAELTALEQWARPDSIRSSTAWAAELAVSGTKVERLPTGLAIVDHDGGLPYGDITVLAGRPGLGKSALAHLIGAYVSRTHPVLLLSCEMTARQVGERLLRRHTLEQIAASQLSIADPTSPTLAEIQSLIRRDVLRRGRPLVIVDHLGNLRADRRHERHELAVAEAVQSLRMAAKAFDLPLLLVAQLNRQVEHRSSPKPHLSDLRDSGAIEQEAAQILFVWSPDERPEGKDPLDLTLTLAKNRHGPTAEAPYRFFKARGEIVPASDRDEPAWIHDA